MATNLTTAGSAEDKLRWAFRMYDKDGSGEFYSIFKFNFSNDHNYHCYHRIHIFHHYNHRYKPRPRINRHGGTG